MAATRSMARVSLAITLVYLILEFALNARILDVISEANRDALRGVEFWGRILFGVALSIVVWKLVASSSLSPRALLLCLMTVGPVAYFGQKAVLDQLVAKTTPEFRRHAAQLAMITAAAPQGAVTFKNVPLQGADWDDPDGRVFLALLPALVSTSSAFAKTVESTLPTLAKLEARKGLGDVRVLHERILLLVSEELSRQYERYFTAVGFQQRAATAEQGWAEYLRRLEKLEIDPYRPTSFQKSAVLSQLRSNSLFMPEGWRLYDQKGFVAAWNERAGRFSKAAPVDDSGSAPRKSIEPGLNRAEFDRHPEVQAGLRAKLLAEGLKPNEGEIDPEMGLRIFNDSVYEPTLIAAIEPKLSNVLARAGEFDEGGRLRQEGLDAARRTLIPPVAIAFSMLGALLNLIALLFALVKALFHRSRPLGIALAMGSIAGMVAMPIAVPSRVALSEPYGHLIDSMKTDETGRVVGPVLDWTVRMEPAVYSIGTFLRQNVLGNISFSHPVS